MDCDSATGHCNCNPEWRGLLNLLPRSIAAILLFPYGKNVVEYIEIHDDSFLLYFVESRKSLKIIVKYQKDYS